MSRKLRRAARHLGVTVVLLASCSADSCGCDAYEQRAFPSDKLDVTMPSAGQVRVTSSGLDYIESQVPYIMGLFLPGGLNFCIPLDTSANPDICVESTCTGGANGCQVGLQLVDQNINPMSPDTLEVEVAIGDVAERLNFDYDAGLFDVNCYVNVFKNGAAEDVAATVMGTIPVRIVTDAASPMNEVGVQVGQASLNLEDVDFRIHGRGNVGDTVLCEGASLVVRTFFRGRIESEVQTMLDGVVADVERGNLCQQCVDTADCPTSATCNAGVCDYATGCVPRTLGIEGRLTLTTPEIIGAMREANPRADFLGKAADLARVDTGVTVGLRGGAEPVAISDCVPVDVASRPAIGTIPASDAINGDTRPGGAAFMFGAGIHKSAIEQALWSIWASGATCLNISNEDIAMLTTTTFSLAAPSLRDLVGNGQPATIGFVANQPPTVTLGENRVTPMGDTYVIDEPLLTVHWPDVDLHVFGYAQDRMVRLLTLRLDFELPIAVAYDGTDLVPIIAGIESAIANVELRRAELTAEAEAQILDAVPTFLAIAGPFLDYGLPDGITLPEFLGFRLDLEQDDITSVDNGDFIAVYASLARSATPFVATANTAIIDQSVSYNRVLPSGFVRPEVTLDVHGFETDPFNGGPDYEYAWRVDRGLWSMYHRTNTLVVDDAILAVQGEHEIEVRARRIGAIRTTDPTPAVAIVDIAWERPTLEIKNVPRPKAPAVKVEKQPAPSPNDGARLGCSSAGAGESTLPFLMFFVVVVGRRRRRRPHPAPQEYFFAGKPAQGALAMLGHPSPEGEGRFLALLIILLALTSGCYKGCKGELKTNADEFCLGADCVVDQDCNVDGDCSGICPNGAGGICEASRCQCVIACDPGCEDDAFCCLTTKECVPYGDLCDDGSFTCDPGYEPGVIEATPNRETCELKDFACDCVPLPPLPVGWHGGQTSIDSDGGLTVIATHNKTYGDLMAGVVIGDGMIRWHYAAGVPDGEEILGDPMGPRGGVEASGPEVGTHSAVAIDDAGRAHVFYRDEDTDMLMWGIATFANADDPPTFETAALDETPGAGYWTAAVSAGSQIHVVYALIDDPQGSEVRHVILDGAASPAPTTPTSLAIDPSEWDGKGYPLVAGALFDLTQTGGTPYLVYYDGIGDRVARMQFDGTAWSDPLFIATGNGPWGSGTLSKDGLEHIVFQQSGGLRYSRFGDTSTSVVIDGLRDLDDDYWTGTIGEDSAIRLDGAAVTVAYQDAFDRVLVVSTSPDGTTGTWSHMRHGLDATGSGFWIAMTRRGEKWVADMVVDRGNEDSPAYVRVTRFE